MITRTAAHSPDFSQPGFSLVELMVAVAVLGILLAVGVPAFRDMLLNNRRSTAVNELLSGLMLARSEAGKLGQDVTVCPLSTDPVQCGDNWKSGVMIFNNPDKDTVVDTGAAPPNTEQVLRTFPLDPGDVTGFSITSTRSTVTFRPFNTQSDNATIRICDPRDKNQPGEPEVSRQIVVSLSGRARIEGQDAGQSITCP